MDVWVVLERRDPVERLVPGVVASVIEERPFHPRGILVRLTDGSVGRVHSTHPFTGGPPRA
jgi:uncharacterized repeat protein (TIGR03833 family)